MKTASSNCKQTSAAAKLESMHAFTVWLLKRIDLDSVIEELKNKT